MLKSCGGRWVVVGGLQDFSVSPNPLLGLLGLELGWTGLWLDLEDCGWGLWFDNNSKSHTSQT